MSVEDKKSLYVTYFNSIKVQLELLMLWVH